MIEDSDLLRTLIARGKLVSATRAGRLVGQVQLFAGEVVDNVEIFQPYGVSANPEPGGDVVLLTLGTRDHKVVIAVDDTSRRIRDLAAGELGISDGSTQFVARGWGAEISTPGQLYLHADGAGNVLASALNLGALGATFRRLIDERILQYFNNHTHPANGAVPSQQISDASTCATTDVKAS